MPDSGLAPLQVQLLEAVAAVTIAATEETALFSAPWNGTLQTVEYIADTAITGANSNTRRVSLVNKGQAGAGVTEMAALQFDAGVNAVAFDAKAITNSATPANLAFVAGDVLTWKSAAVGSGLADPGGTVVLRIGRD